MTDLEFQKSPEGQYIAAVAEIQRLAVDLNSEAERSRNARARSWVGELRTCEASMARVQMIARKIVELSLDAQVECGIAAGAEAAE